jgi:hypothetical protein
LLGLSPSMFGSKNTVIELQYGNQLCVVSTEDVDEMVQEELIFLCSILFKITGADCSRSSGRLG